MIDNSKKYIELRSKYKKIVFNDYSIANEHNIVKIKFNYTIDGLSDFTTIWTIDKLNKDICIDNNKLDFLIFSLGMVEMISYYKIVCPSIIDIKCHSFSKEEENWWKKLYTNGLSEFYYTNNIKIESNMFEFTYNTDRNISNNHKNDEIINDNVLIPIGGGKDSAVSIEVLKNDYDTYCYIINPRKATLETFKVSGIDSKKLIIAKRVFDDKIVKFNNEGYLNGHTPFSALVAFSSVIAAYINGIENVALSNESSANESTVKGMSVNHQYSKTYEFECDFREYEKKYINSGVNYFSLLRPLTEVGIAKIFSSLTKYHEIFRSCNVGSKEDIWCAACAKCLFVFIILSPFIGIEKLTEVFGKNMLDDMNLKGVFDKLIGILPEKPFECVGSRDEVNACLDYLSKNILEENQPELIKYYKTLNINNNINLLDLCASYDENNNLPSKCEKILKGYIKEC